jgi:hypothetical protein
LGLSDEQAQKVKLLKLNTEKGKIKSDAEVKSLGLDIEAALGKDEVDVKSTSALLEKKYSVKSQEAKALLGAYAELKKVLSKDQLKQLHDIWSKEEMGEGKCAMMKGKCSMMKGAEEREHKMEMK